MQVVVFFFRKNLSSVNRELIINATQKGVDIALLEDEELVELHREPGDKKFSTGDMFLGKVTRIVPGLNAAFIDVGYEKDAFLHYTDLSPVIRTTMKYTQLALAGNISEQKLLDGLHFEPEIPKGGKIDEVLKRGQSILVQILKEPISSKGPRLTCELTLPGRYLVLVPFDNSIGISKKITNPDERKRLQRLMESIKPKNFGIVVRTVAEGKSVAALHEDMKNLIDKWKQLTKNLAGATPVTKVHSELAKTTGILRDLLNDSFNQIVVNDPKLESDIKEYIARIAPDKKDIVKYYGGKTPIFDHFHITRQIKSLFGKTVTLSGGAYLVIEKTEACHVIDINSGNRVSSKNGQEQNALRTNLDAAKEIARQLRLRDMGGIIVCDFIDMKEAANKQYVFNAMKQYMEKDRSRHTILPLSKFNLMQITRERSRPEISVETSEECPTCLGTGKIGPSILITDEIEEKLEQIMQQKKQKVALFAHPYLAAYLKYGLLKSKQMKWFWKYKQWIPIYPNEEYHLTEYHFMDHKGEEILL
jgi:ribonuclease G